jgi:hypothetical protein
MVVVMIALDAISGGLVYLGIVSALSDTEPGEPVAEQAAVTPAVSTGAAEAEAAEETDILQLVSGKDYFVGEEEGECVLKGFNFTNLDNVLDLWEPEILAGEKIPRDQKLSILRRANHMPGVAEVKMKLLASTDEDVPDESAWATAHVKFNDPWDALVYYTRVTSTGAVRFNATATTKVSQRRFSAMNTTRKNRRTAPRSIHQSESGTYHGGEGNFVPFTIVGD